jgi:hypothetical protein
VPIITYDQYMKDTARFGVSRSPELKAVDEAFRSYEARPTAVAKEQLEKAFEAWKRKQGNDRYAWVSSARNSSQAFTKLDALLAGQGDNDRAFGAGRVPDFMHEDLINARLGVLYLFSRLSVTPGAFNLLLEGGFDLGDQAMALGGASDQVKSDYGMVKKTKSVLEKAGDRLEEKLALQTAPKNIYVPQGAKPSIDVSRPVLLTSEKIQQDADRLAPLANQPMLQKIKEKVKHWFDLLVEKVKSTIQEKFATAKEKYGTLEGFAGLVKQVVNGCVTYFAAKAAPFVSAGLEIASGVGKTIDAAVKKFRTWREGLEVEVAQGHPATVVDSIKRAMTMSLFEGLWDTLKGSAKLAMDIVSFGAGALIDLLIAAGELLIKFIWRLVETIRINRFCAMAQEYWNNHLSPDSIHRRPFAFSEWYRSYALNIPFISVLTLNTGICGDKMRWLTMFNSGGQISSEEFQRGVKFLDNLKPWGAKYLKDCGYKIRTLGGDIFVDRLVNTFATSHEAEKTVFDRVIAVATA